MFINYRYKGYRNTSLMMNWYYINLFILLMMTLIMNISTNNLECTELNGDCIV